VFTKEIEHTDFPLDEIKTVFRQQRDPLAERVLSNAKPVLASGLARFFYFASADQQRQPGIVRVHFARSAIARISCAPPGAFHRLPSPSTEWMPSKTHRRVVEPPLSAAFSFDTRRFQGTSGYRRYCAEQIDL
jgi:hypothetical protein